MKNKASKMKKVVTGLTLMALVVMSYSQTVLAFTITGSKAVTGTVALLNDVTGAIMIIDPAVAVVLLIYNLFKMKHAEDDGEAKPIKKKMKTIAIAGVSIFLVSTLFNVVLSYYK